MTEIHDPEHPEEDLLERYSLDLVSGEELQSFEEHLLICEECQDRLTESDAYVRAMRAATAELSGHDGSRVAEWLVSRLSGFLRLPWPTWAGVGVAGLMALMWLGRPEAPPPLAVFLHSTRGAESAAVNAVVGSGRPLLLELDVEGLPRLPAYEAEIVDSAGREIWRSVVQPKGGRLFVLEPKALDGGTFWVRLYSAQGNTDLLREYGLQVVASRGF